MSTHDLTIANQTAANARADINSALQALGSTSSGTADPPTTYANQLQYRTNSNLLRIRSEANDDWINIGHVNQDTLKFNIINDTNVTNLSGVPTGLLGDQATSVWQAGTGTTQSLVSPANVKSAIDSQVSTAPVWVATDSVSTYSATGLSSYNAWVKTPITNTIISNLSGAATDTTNYEIDLPAGTYYVEWTLPIARVASDTADKVGVRFRNVTDNVSVGASQQIKIGDWQNLNFHGCGKFTIAGTKSFQLQAWSSEVVTLRYGDPISGDLATFAIIKVYKA